MEEDIEYLQQLIGIEKEYKYKPIKIKTSENTAQAIRNLIARYKELEKQMGKDLDVVYIKGVYDERDKWKKKVKEKIGIKMQKNNNIIHNYKKKYGKDIYWYDEVQQANAENYIYKEILQELIED